MYSIAFVGHHPEKLGGYDWSSPKNKRIGLAIKKIILKEMKSVDEKDFTFYFGGALGTDQMCFELVKFIQTKHPEWNISKIICIPFKGQSNRWPFESRSKYQEQILSSEKTVYVDNKPDYKINFLKVGMYHPAKFAQRNHYLVDNAQTIIAVYDGYSIGITSNCVEYALTQNKNLIIINPDNY